MKRLRTAALLLVGAALPAAGTELASPAAIEVPVLAQNLQKGAILSAADFAREARPGDQARGALALREAIGMEAARNLPAGLIVRSGDLIRAQLVRRGEPVSIRFRSGALTIVATGRALGSGADGDLVRVVSLSTNRTLDAIVDGPGAVRVDP